MFVSQNPTPTSSACVRSTRFSMLDSQWKYAKAGKTVSDGIRSLLHPSDIMDT